MSEANQMLDLRFKCEEMKAIQERKEALEEQLKLVNADFDQLRLREIPEMMEAMGVKNATFEGLGRVQLASDIYASTREGQKEAAMQWLRDCGYEGMISEQYNASSLKALLRRMIVQGDPTPDDIFSVTPFTRASLVKK
jgi:hypothetical protein